MKRFSRLHALESSQIMWDLDIFFLDLSRTGCFNTLFH